MEKDITVAILLNNIDSETLNRYLTLRGYKVTAPEKENERVGLRVYVEAEVDLSSFDEDDMVSYLEENGYVVIEETAAEKEAEQKKKALEAAYSTFNPEIKIAAIKLVLGLKNYDTYDTVLSGLKQLYE